MHGPQFQPRESIGPGMPSSEPDGGERPFINVGRGGGKRCRQGVRNELRRKRTQVGEQRNHSV
jgi:hypothetical protein